jgi:hypothetical protein
MRDLYIGDFINEEDAKESWENLVKRKQAENQVSPVMRALMLLAYGLLFFGLYYYLTK